MSDFWEPRPLPDVSIENEAFWNATADRRLLLRACEACGFIFWYPRAHCPDCNSTDVVWQEAAGTGTLFSYSVVERIEGWPEKARPLVVAYVKLAEGPRILSNVVCSDPDALTVGQPLEVRFVPSDEQSVAVPVFEPADDGTAAP